MFSKRTTGIIIGVVLVILLYAGQHIGMRWYRLRKLYRNLQTQHRAKIVPTELDLTDINATKGVTCNIGYAEFIIPGDSLVDLKSVSGTSVVAKTESLTLAFLSPWNPKASKNNLAMLKQELSKLPKDNSLRKTLAGNGITTLDLEIYMERLTPEPFLKAIFSNYDLFKYNTMNLLQKSAMQIGNQSVHTYKTSETRGLIRVGKKQGDKSYAHVVIENLTGTQSVGVYVNLPKGKQGDIMDIVPSIIKTFRFTVEGLESKDKIKEIIAGAGISPRPENKAMDGDQQQQSIPFDEKKPATDPEATKTSP